MSFFYMRDRKQVWRLGCRTRRHECHGYEVFALLKVQERLPAKGSPVSEKNRILTFR